MILIFVFFLFVWAILVLAAPFFFAFCAGNCAVLVLDLAQKKRDANAPRSFWRAFKNGRNAFSALLFSFVWLSYALPLLPDLLAMLQR